MPKQHVDSFRKISLRRELLAQALPGPAYIPYCGDGDMAAELYSDRDLYGCDTDPARIATIRERLPAGHWSEADADSYFCPGVEAPFAVADFDAYNYPYHSFRAFWTEAPKADRLVMFFTDGNTMAITRQHEIVGKEGRTGRYSVVTLPDGSEHQSKDAFERRRLYTNYWIETVQPWLKEAIAPWSVVKTSFYQRGMYLLYWGAVVERVRVANVPNVPKFDPKETQPDAYQDPSRAYKFDPRAQQRFLDSLAEANSRAEAAKTAGVNLKTVRRHMERNERFRDAVEWAEEQAIGVIENSLFMAAKSGNVIAQQVFLYNRASERWKDQRGRAQTQRAGEVTAEEMERLLLQAARRIAEEQGLDVNEVLEMAQSLLKSV